jgi:hypothetical protein
MRVRDRMTRKAQRKCRCHHGQHHPARNTGALPGHRAYVGRQLRCSNHALCPLLQKTLERCTAAALGLALGVQALLRDGSAALGRGQRLVRSCGFQSMGKDNIAG